MKSSLVGIGLPCCLQAMCNPPWCRDGNPALGTSPSLCMGAELAAACNAEVSRGAGRAGLCRHGSVPFSSSEFLSL